MDTEGHRWTSPTDITKDQVINRGTPTDMFVREAVSIGDKVRRSGERCKGSTVCVEHNP